MSAFVDLLRCKAERLHSGYTEPRIRNEKATQKHTCDILEWRPQSSSFDNIAPEIEKLVHSASVYDAVWNVVVAEKEEAAAKLLDLLQLWRDTIPGSHPLHNNVIYMIVKLASKSGRIPPSLLLTDLTIPRMVSKFSGAGGDIYAGRFRNMDVAVKKPRFSSAAEKEDWLKLFVREALIWRQLQHQNVLPFYGIDNRLFKYEDVSTIVMPWMSLGSLDDFVRNKEYEPRLHRYHLLHGIASGLQYLHSLKITHGDVKGANILITPKKDAALADFGLIVIGQTTKHRPTTIDGQCGTPDFSAPELLLGRILRSNPLVDIYAFACLCRQMWSRKHRVWPGLTQRQIEAALSRTQRPSRPTGEECLSPSMSDDMWHIIEKCWHEDPVQRLKLKDVIAFFERDGPLDGSYVTTVTVVVNYNARPNTKDLTVYKGEIVRVVAPIPGFFKVINPSNQQGFVPAHVLPDLTMFTVTAHQNSTVGSIAGTERGGKVPELTYKTGDELHVLFIAGESWMAKNKQGHIGFVQTRDLDLSRGWSGTRASMRVRFDHKPSKVPLALQLPRGSVVTVKRMCGDWALAESKDCALGVIRTSYLKPA